MTVLLERENSLDQLDAALRETSQGSGRIVLVYGEAGIGKTSLVDRFIELRRRGCRTLRGRCDSLFTPQPLGPLYDMAADLPRELRELLQSAADRLILFGGFLRALQDSPDPTIVIVEDVHWADAATLDLLKHVGRRLEGVRALVILTYRDDEIDRRHPLWSLLGNLPPSMVRRLLLLPLSEAAVAILAGDPRRAREIHALSGGNPFFVTELLAGSGDTVPPTIRESTLARAQQLSPAARTVLDFCSVVPTYTDLWLLQATINPASAYLDECARTGLLIVEGDIVRFRHELARQAVESALPASSAQTLHARILEALLARGEDRIPLACIVHHAAGAQDATAVRRYAPAAARQAASLGAHREAAAHYATVLRYADPADAAAHASLFESYAYECYVTGQIDAAIEAQTAALRIRQQLQDRVKEGDNLRWLSRLNWFLCRHAEALQRAKDAIEVLETLPPGPGLAMAYSNRSQAHMLEGDNREAVDWGNRALGLAEQLSLGDVRIHALNNIGTAQLQCNDQQGWKNLKQSLQLALEHDLHEHACRAYCNLSWESVLYRDYPRANRYFEAGLTYTLERDLDFWHGYILGARARVHLEQGRWQQATAEAEAILRSSRLPVQRFDPLLVLGLVRLRRGDPGGDELLDEARDMASPIGAALRIGLLQAARAEAAWLRGQKDLCREEASVGYEWAARKGEAHLAEQLAFWLWRAGGAPNIQTSITPYAHQLRGDPTTAAAEWQRLGCPYEEALALADGDSFGRLRALALLDQLGATRVSASLRRGLRAQGVRKIPRGARPTTRQNPAGLTLREMEVLKLLAGDLSNRRIAEQLCISVKTVDQHVSSVLAKLEVESREQAVTQAVERGLIAQDR
jgi:DNA-binding CsgD family transcriptional regulator